MSLIVSEIFHSLQGESSFCGLACTFIRLTGCNLSCTWCDTTYALENGTPMSLEAILGAVDTHGGTLVEITGGEPLAQDNTPALAKALLDKHYTVLVETNGSMDIARLPKACIKIMDIKCPGSGESGAVLWKNLDLLGPADEVKFVVADKADLHYAGRVIRQKLDALPAGRIHISPVLGRIDLEKLASWMLEDNIKARLSLQQHKLIWGPDAEGV